MVPFGRGWLLRRYPATVGPRGSGTPDPAGFFPNEGNLPAFLHQRAASRSALAGTRWGVEGFFEVQTSGPHGAERDRAAARIAANTEWQAGPGCLAGSPSIEPVGNGAGAPHTSGKRLGRDLV